MKKVIFILILLGGLTVGGSYQVGKVIEAELPTILTRVAELGQMQISITSYKRDIFRSSVRSEIVLASISGSREQIFLKHEIWHGPFPFGQRSNGAWQFKPLSALVETTIDQDNPPSGLIGKLLELCPELYQSIEVTRFDFAGNGAARFDVPGFKKTLDTAENSFHIDWQGITGNAAIDKSMRDIKGEVLIPYAKISNQQGFIALEESRTNYKIYEERGLLLGQVTADATSIETGSGRNRTVLKDLQFRNAAKLNDDLASYSIALGIESLQTGSATYGPAGLEVDFVSLDAKAILGVQRKLQTIQSEVKELTEQEIANRVFKIYAEALPDLMKKTPEIKLNYLNLTGPDGEFWSKGNILFENRLNKPIGDINSFLGTIRAKGESQISKALLKSVLAQTIKGQISPARTAGQLGDINDDQFNAMAAGAAAEQLANMETGGLLVAMGDKYHVDFTYKNRQAVLNGKPLQ